MAVVIYNQDHKEPWDEVVKCAKNSTFLLERNFMDYHKQRFKDCSLLFTDCKNRYVGALPANISNDGRTIYSHGGLTYGGLLITREIHLGEVKEMLKEAASLYLNRGAETLEYKPTPYIYHKYPAQEDLYWLFRSEALLKSRTVSTTIDLQHPLPFSTLRKRKVKKAISEKYSLSKNAPEDWESYWNILSDVLETQHHTHPVHSLPEILDLYSKFPANIQLFTVRNGSECIAGCVIFDCGSTIHVQYISANEVGKRTGALDYLFSELISFYANQGKKYFDFGISTEEGGHYLNEGLLFQKEGFGGRAVCYDSYTIDLNKLAQL